MTSRQRDERGLAVITHAVLMAAIGLLVVGFTLFDRGYVYTAMILWTVTMVLGGVGTPLVEDWAKRSRSEAEQETA
jgi:hypothetical protein